jgi:hypothetical protein
MDLSYRQILIDLLTSLARSAALEEVGQRDPAAGRLQA